MDLFIIIISILLFLFFAATSVYDDDYFTKWEINNAFKSVLTENNEISKIFENIPIDGKTTEEETEKIKQAVKESLLSRCILSLDKLEKLGSFLDIMINEKIKKTIKLDPYEGLSLKERFIRYENEKIKYTNR